MGLWSKFKKAVRAAVRFVIKIDAAIGRGITNIVIGLFLPFVQKKLRLQICILHPPDEPPLATVEQAIASRARAAAILSEKFDTKLIDFGPPQFIKEIPPSRALDAREALRDDFGEAGSFFAKYTVGWNVIPITAVFPITVFIVRSIVDLHGKPKRGSSQWIATEYLLLTPVGLNDKTTLSHEIGHCCSLLHRKPQDNLMQPDHDRGTSVTGWQKYLFRTSRHVNFW
jgi:hypothetical protein